MDDGSRFDGATWRSGCNNGNCVEVAAEHGRVGVRDGKDHGDGPVLSFTLEEWRAFIAAAKNGEFDL
ncbi:DUF397 domain-containing protein [Streptosporangium sp. NPDC051022]|uniref:DUF397 domain-containing protein n=1 Tax=Streptosporangium sp. NPDC051022 TaxID=3155752 RepID=UPI0034399E42